MKKLIAVSILFSLVVSAHAVTPEPEGTIVVVVPSSINTTIPATVGTETLNVTGTATIQDLILTDTLTGGHFYVTSVSTIIGGEAGDGAVWSYPVALGYQSGKAMTGGAANPVVIGRAAGEDASGDNVVFIGYFAGNSGGGDGSIAIGRSAKELNNSNYNIAIGYSAFGGSSTSNNGIAIGYKAGDAAAGYVMPYVVLLGEEAGRNSTNSTNGIGIGYHALRGVSAGADVVALGASAGSSMNATGSVLIGRLAGEGSTGSSAVLVGEGAGDGNTGVNVVSLGTLAGAANTGNNSLLLGDGAGQGNSTNGLLEVKMNSQSTTPLMKGLFGSGTISIGTTEISSTTHLVEGGMHINGNLDVSGSVYANGNADVGGDLSVVGSLGADDATFGSWSIDVIADQIRSAPVDLDQIEHYRGVYFSSDFNGNWPSGTLYQNYFLADIDQAGAEVGTWMGGYFNQRMYDGTIGAYRGLYGNLDINGGTITTSAYGMYTGLDIDGSGSMSGNAAALYVFADDDNDVSANTYGIYLSDNTNIDYALYQAGTSTVSLNSLLIANASPHITGVAGKGDALFDSVSIRSLVFPPNAPLDASGNPIPYKVNVRRLDGTPVDVANLVAEATEFPEPARWDMNPEFFRPRLENFSDEYREVESEALINGVTEPITTRVLVASATDMFDAAMVKWQNRPFQKNVVGFLAEEMPSDTRSANGWDVASAVSLIEDRLKLARRVILNQRNRINTLETQVQQLNQARIAQENRLDALEAAFQSHLVGHP